MGVVDEFRVGSEYVVDVGGASSIRTGTSMGLRMMPDSPDSLPTSSSSSSILCLYILSSHPPYPYSC